MKTIRFRDPQPDSVPIIPCDRIPFVVVGRKLFECHQGIAKDGHRKEKRKIEKQQNVKKLENNKTISGVATKSAGLARSDLATEILEHEVTPGEGSSKVQNRHTC